MLEPIRDVVGDEAKAVLLQFLGQELPALHAIDKHITNKTPTLQGLTLNIQEVLNKASNTPGSPPQAMPPQAMPPQAMPPQAMPPQVVPPQVVPPQVIPPQVMPPQAMPTQAIPVHEEETGQLLFNFDYDVAKDIADRLAAIEKKLASLDTTLSKLISSKIRTSAKK